MTCRTRLHSDVMLIVTLGRGGVMHQLYNCSTDEGQIVSTRWRQTNGEDEESPTPGIT